MTEQTKTCTVCGETKALDEFHRNKTKRDGRESSCKACKAAYRREWNAANRDRIAAYGRAYHAEHPEVWWAKKYRYRAHRYKLEPVVEPFTKDDVIDRYGDACVYCGWGDFERLDHWIPVRLGGPHTLDNARPACATCDRDKWVTPGPDYEARLLEQSKARHPAMGAAS